MIRRGGDLAHERLGSGPRAENAEVVGLEGVAERGPVERLAGEQTAHQRQAMVLGGGEGPLLARMLFADRREQPVEGPGLAAQQALEHRASHLELRRLGDEEIADQGVAGEVATQDDVDADPVPGRQARLSEQSDWRRFLPARLAFDRLQSIVEGGADGGAQSVDVDEVADLARVGNCAHAGEDRRLELLAALGETGGQLGTDPAGVAAPRHRLTSTGLHPLGTSAQTGPQDALEHPAGVPDPQVAFWVHGDRGRGGEVFPRAGAAFAPPTRVAVFEVLGGADVARVARRATALIDALADHEDEFAVGGEFGDPAIHAVGDVDIMAGEAARVVVDGYRFGGNVARAGIRVDERLESGRHGMAAEN